MTASRENAELRKLVLGWIEQDRDRLITFLSRLLQARSDNPPGITIEAAAIVQAVLREEGLAYETVNARDDMPNIAASFDGNARGSHLVLNGHLDVFPVEETDPWTHGPWSGAIADGKIWGRGAVDMKSATTASIFTYIYLSRLRAHLKGRLSLTVVSDEETFSPNGAPHLLKLRPDLYGDCCLSGEPSGDAVVRFGEKGRLWLRFTVRTAGAHAAYPYLSASASRIGARLILDLDELSRLEPSAPAEVTALLDKAVPVYEQTLGAGAGEIMQKVTVTVGTVHAGVKVNMVPASCVFEADIRLPIGLEKSDILAVVDDIVARYPEASYEEFGYHAPNWCDPGHQLMQLLIGNVSELKRNQPVRAVGLGATDMRLWRGAGVPAFIFGLSPSLMGKRDENAGIDEFLDLVRIHALTALDYLS
jgi:succinyl-diaminopimelate desuccinylase